MWWFKKNKSQKENNENQPRSVFLHTANNNWEFDMIKSILDENKIPYVTQDRGASGYLKIATGAIFGETDFFVREDALEKATELIELISKSSDDSEISKK